jgi:Mlc titration factor MtfA (ptsG expression regulator)
MKLEPILILVIAFIIALGFIFRKRKVAKIALSTADINLLEANVEFYQGLSKADKKRFEQKIVDFLAGVKIEGVGLQINQLDRLLVAASAVIPIFGFKEWEYKNLGSVVLYPDTFNKDFEFEGGDRNIGGMVGTGFMNGQMILSKSALHHGFSKSAGKENTGIHEFVHLLDKADGATDGIPDRLLDKQYILPWLKMMHEEIQKIEQNKSDINPYAITNEAEFLAVAAEYFFEQPEIFKDKHPELYKLLNRIFAQNPA